MNAIEQIEELNKIYLQSIVENQEEEYCDRIVYIETIWKGSFSVPANVNFNPRLFIGTQKEYDIIIAEHYMSDTYGKIIATNKYNTIEEYNKIKRK